MESPALKRCRRGSKPPEPKRCPRLDCPDPTLAFRFKGSVKQLQYHCYGCWRLFNDGGQQRGWARQVRPLKKWLLSRPPHLRGKPVLLPLPRPSPPPSSAVQDSDATLYEVPASTVLPADAVPSPREVTTGTASAHSRAPSNAAGRSRRAGILGEERGLASDFDVHIADGGDHGDSSTPAWEEWEKSFQLSGFLSVHGDYLFDPESTPAWAISDSPVPDAPGGNEVPGAITLPAPASLPSVVHSDNSKSAPDSKSPHATDKHLAGPSAQKTFKLTFEKYTGKTLVIKSSGS